MRGVPVGIRTRGLPLRRRTLYPAELRKHRSGIYIYRKKRSYTWEAGMSFVPTNGVKGRKTLYSDRFGLSRKAPVPHGMQTGAVFLLFIPYRDREALFSHTFYALVRLTFSCQVPIMYGCWKYPFVSAARRCKTCARTPAPVGGEAVLRPRAGGFQ